MALPIQLRWCPVPSRGAEEWSLAGYRWGMKRKAALLAKESGRNRAD